MNYKAGYYGFIVAIWSAVGAPLAADVLFGHELEGSHVTAVVVIVSGFARAHMISAKVKGFREAQQISVILLIPIFALVLGQVTGAIIFGLVVVTALIGLFAVIDLIVFRTGVKLFRRGEILSKLA